MINELLEIVPVDLQHAPQIQLLASDKAIADTTSLPHPYPADGAVNFIKDAMGKRERKEEFVFAVMHKEEGLIGTSCLLKCNYENLSAVLGYWIGIPYWGKGYATTAARLTIQYAFDVLLLRRLTTSCIDNNSASLRVLEKIGFRITGESELSLPKWDKPKRMIDLELLST